MLSRHQIRIKLFHCLFAQNVNDNIDKEWKNCFDSYSKLYQFVLKILIYFKKRAEKEIQLGLQKKQPKQSDLNPNKSFINNIILSKLEKELINENFNDEHIILICKNIFSIVKEKKYYINYMNIKKNEIDNDIKILIDILKKDILTNTDIIDVFEEKSIYWNDDISSAFNSFVYKTSQLKKLNQKTSLIKLDTFKNKSDKEFAKTLYSKTIKNKDKVNTIILKIAANWDIDRISKSDLALLQLAITEITDFEDIPNKVTINEYIKISKEYCSKKSFEFINGILDSYIKSNYNISNK